MKENKRFLLFLDDVRSPQNCATYMHLRIGVKNPIYLEDWVVVKNYNEFIKVIEEKGIPEFVSYDHDLAEIHYNPETWTEGFEYYEETGLDCARWLVEYCKQKGVPHPEYAVHSMNPVGTENIEKCLKSQK